MMSKSKKFYLIQIHFLVENFFEKNFILYCYSCKDTAQLPSSRGRVVKAMDQKSIGVSPRRFESCRLRCVLITSKVIRSSHGSTYLYKAVFLLRLCLGNLEISLQTQKSLCSQQIPFQQLLPVFSKFRSWPCVQIGISAPKRQLPRQTTFYFSFLSFIVKFSQSTIAGRPTVLPVLGSEGGPGMDSRLDMDIFGSDIESHDVQSIAGSVACTVN